MVGIHDCAGVTESMVVHVSSFAESKWLRSHLLRCFRWILTDPLGVLHSENASTSFHVATVEQLYLSIFDCGIYWLFLISIYFETVLYRSIFYLLSNIIE